MDGYVIFFYKVTLVQIIDNFLLLWHTFVLSTASPIWNTSHETFSRNVLTLQVSMKTDK